MEINRRTLKLIESLHGLKQAKKSEESKKGDECCFKKSSENLQLLEHCNRLFSSLSEVRQSNHRHYRYVYGDQWGDYITTPEGRYITEAEYIRQQGVVPLTTNVIRKLINSALGLYSMSQNEPIAICRDKDEQKYGEMMSIMLQYILQTNDFKEIDRRAFEEAMITGFYIASDSYQWDDEKQRFEIKMNIESPNNVFFESKMQDIRMRDLSLIGFIRDFSLEEILSEFATTSEQAEQLRKIYSYVLSGADSFYGRDYKRNTETEAQNFYIPNDPAMCRVIEVWRQETKPRLRIHDRLSGEYYKIEESEKATIDEENQRRIEELLSIGGKAEDAQLIEYEFFFDRYWYYRFITPDGFILKEGETPFAHGSHPYTISAYPLINGEIHSKVADVIDQQRYINRYLTQRDIQNGVAMKGLLVYDKQSAENAGVTQADMDKAISRPGASIALDLSRGHIPTQIFTNPNAQGDMGMVNMMLQMIDGIFGNTMASRGERPSAGTPASLYALQAQQSNQNLADFVGWFQATNSRRFLKLIKTIQQYYKEPMYINIAGAGYSDEARTYTPDKVCNIDFDVIITQSSNSPIYRMEAENMLQFLVQSGLMQNLDMAIFYADNSQSQFSKQLSERLKALKESQEKSQQEQAMAMQQMQQAMQTEPQQEQAEPPQQEGESI